MHSFVDSFPTQVITEYWVELPVLYNRCLLVIYFLYELLVTQSCPILCNAMDCRLPGSSVHGGFPGKNTGVGCHFLLQGIFLTQGSVSPALQADFSIYSIYFIFSSIYMSIPISQFTLPLSPSLKPYIWFLYPWLYFCYVNTFICIHFSIPHISDIIYLSFSVQLTSLSVTISMPIHAAVNYIILFYFMVEYTYITSSLSILLLMGL